ncbi:hypothetical protein NIES25_70300 (plasmid) [Nostoc linckia NIES-25]|nr:hypothetical protein NIES25_70300 [Nostoc linckia NIES-25]
MIPKKKSESSGRIYKALYVDENGYCLTVLEYKNEVFTVKAEYFDLEKISYKKIKEDFKTTGITTYERRISNQDISSRIDKTIKVLELNETIGIMNIKALINDKRLVIDTPDLQNAIHQYDPENTTKGHRVKALMLGIAEEPKINHLLRDSQPS